MRAVHDYIETVEELRDEFMHWSFKMPGYSWSLGFEQTGYDDLRMLSYGPTAILRFHVETVDTYGKTPGTVTIGQYHRLPPFPIQRDLVPMILRRAVHECVLHEADEWLKRDGEIIFNPHERSRG